MQDFTALARAILDAQPFSRLLGTELIRAGEQGVELALALTPDLRQQHGFAHGGVIAYLADNALTFAGGIGLGTAVLTSQMNIHYLNPARGGRLVARAVIIASRASSALARCDVLAVEDGIETTAAFATALIRRSGTAGSDAPRSGICS